MFDSVTIMGNYNYNTDMLTFADHMYNVHHTTFFNMSDYIWLLVMDTVYERIISLTLLRHFKPGFGDKNINVDP